MTLAARALDFGFRDHVVGRSLDCALEAGEVVCLLGPNGSGKSTLMRTLLGLQPRLAGEVTLDGRDLGAWPAAVRARLFDRHFHRAVGDYLPHAVITIDHRRGG